MNEHELIDWSLYGYDVFPAPEMYDSDNSFELYEKGIEIQKVAPIEFETDGE